MRVVLERASSGPTLEGPVHVHFAWEVTPALTILEGPRRGECFILDEVRRALILGRGQEADVVIPDSTISRRHLRVFVEPGEEGDRARLIDMESRNGTFVNGTPATDAYLEPGDKIQIGDVLLRFDYLDRRDVDFLQQMVDKVRESEVDPLTGLATRKVYEAMIAAEQEGPQRPPACVMMIDLDYFKRVNDIHGNAVGDEALRAAARVVQRSIRGNDRAIRHGGEEFLVILPGAPLEVGLRVAEKIRLALTEEPVSGMPLPAGLSASIGVAIRMPGEDLGSVVGRADRATYRAKSGGRNRVVAAPGGGG